MKDLYLTMAACEAEKGMKREAGGPFGAVLVKSGKIISRAHNTVLEKKDATCHAEINAIRTASKKLKTLFLTGCEIYSTTEPCPMCFSAIHWARLRRVVFCTTIADVNRLGFNELLISNQKLKKWGRSSVKLIRKKNPACVQLLKKWKSLREKKTY